GHEVIAAWRERYLNFTLITQNVDGLHERAGTRNLVRFHGSFWEVLCYNGGAASPPRGLDEAVRFFEIPPKCPHGRGPARPAVGWFGEGIDSEVLARSVQALDCDVFFTIGTSSLVYPAAQLVHEAKARGAYTVEVNVEQTRASSLLDLALQGPAEEVLGEI